MRSMIKVRLAFVIGAVALGLATTPGYAQTTNSWTTDGTSYSGDNNDTAHWSTNNVAPPAPLPGATDAAWFTNAQSGYTVTFQENTTNRNLRVGTDNVTFDLNGYFWRLEQPDTGWGNDHLIGYGAGETSTVTFSSSSSGSNTVYMTRWTGGFGIGNATGKATININTNLGYGVRLWGYNSTAWGITAISATINISGPGAEWNTGTGGGGWNNSILNVTDGGKFVWSAGDASALFAGGPSTGNVVNVSNGGIVDLSAAAGKDSLLCWVFGGDEWNITAGGTWLANGIEVGERNYTGHPKPYDGSIRLDGAGSSLTATRIDIGAGGDLPGAQANGQVVVSNSAVLTVSSNILVGAQYASGGSNTNRLVLSDAQIRLGTGSYGGSLTNRGIMKAMGTITGLGSSPALVRNEKLLEVGGSIGTLTLTNANLELAAGSQTLWEFSDTGLDQINVVGGWAKLDGTNLFSLAAGSANPTPGVKWGLGVYDFVLGTGVTAGVNFYANMTNLLGGYLLTEGVDYRFGVVDLGGGLQALELAFVPEPSTVLLLVGGGLVLWRVRRRK